MAGFSAINGVYFAQQDIGFKINGLQFVGFKSLNYKDNVSKALVRGAQQKPLGITRGRYEASGDFELFLPQASTLINMLVPLGVAFGGWRNVPLSFSVSYGPVLGAFPSFVNDIITGIYISELEGSNSEGDDGLTRKFGLKISGEILWNGVSGVLDTNSVGAIG
jgi:hypothetical protein